MHLLLASQRLEEGRLRGLDTYLSYRIGLKTFSVAESRIVLGAPDAFELPTAPGNGYLKFDTTGLVRFKGAYVSGPVRDPRVGADDLGWVDPQAFRLAAPHQRRNRCGDAPQFGAGDHATATRRSAPPWHRVRARTDDADRRRAHAVPRQTLLDVAVSRLAGPGCRPMRCGCRR